MYQIKTVKKWQKPAWHERWRTMNLEKNQTKNSPIYTVTDLKFPGKISYMRGFLKILNKNFTALFDKSFFLKKWWGRVTSPPPPLNWQNSTSDIEILLEISKTIVDNCLVLGWHNGYTLGEIETQPSRVVHIDDINIDSHGRQKKSPQYVSTTYSANFGQKCRLFI